MPRCCQHRVLKGQEKNRWKVVSSLWEEHKTCSCYLEFMLLSSENVSDIQSVHEQKPCEDFYLVSTFGVPNPHKGLGGWHSCKGGDKTWMMCKWSFPICNAMSLYYSLKLEFDEWFAEDADIPGELVLREADGIGLPESYFVKRQRLKCFCSWQMSSLGSLCWRRLSFQTSDQKRTVELSPTL
jgi:hypothetical protein